MHRKRLQILKGVLNRWAEYRGNLKFYLGQWLELPDEYKNHDHIKALKKAINGDNYCGTTACACGVAASIPSFKRDGLGLIKNDFGTIRPRYRGKTNYAAIQAFFGLTESETAWLFSPEEYSDRQHKKPEAVVARIQKLLDGKSAPDIYTGGYSWNA